MTLTLALVATSDDEHGSTIHDTETQSTDGNAGSGSLLLTGLLTLVAGTKGVVTTLVIVVLAARLASSTISTVTFVVAGERNLGVDYSSQVINNVQLVVVQARVGRPHAHSQLLNDVLGVVELGNGGDVTILVTSVPRNKLDELDLVSRDATGGSKSVGQVVEDLSSGDGVAGNEVVVEREQETNVDLSCARRSRLVTTVGKNNLGDVGRQSLGGGSSLGARRGRVAERSRLNNNGSRQPVLRVSSGGGGLDASDPLLRRGLRNLGRRGNTRDGGRGQLLRGCRHGGGGVGCSGSLDD